MIEQWNVDFKTSNTPNSKKPVLVYRNSIDESIIASKEDEGVKREKLKDFFDRYGWRAEKIYPSVTQVHYHPNVHEAYAIIGGSSTLCLGLDVTLDPKFLSDSQRREFVEVDVTMGDIIVIPAGVSHCSKYYSREYRYLAAYPNNGEKWKSVRKEQVRKKGSPGYDNSTDIFSSISAPMPYGDPVYGKQPGTLVDIWSTSH